MKLLTSFYQISGFYFSEPQHRVVQGNLAWKCVPAAPCLHVHQSEIRDPNPSGTLKATWRCRYVTNACEMFLSLFSYFTLFCDSFVKQRTEAKIKNLMTEIRSDLNCNLHFKLACLPLRKFFFLFVVNSLILVAVLIMVFKRPGECFVSADSRFHTWLPSIKVCALNYRWCFQFSGFIYFLLFYPSSLATCLIPI